MDIQLFLFFRDFCWINNNLFLVPSFLMPVFLIVGANLYFLLVAFYKIHQHNKDSLIVHKSRTASLKIYVKGLLGLLFLLGITWSLAILSVTQPSVVITYIFTILNSMQGFFIFIFNCILNKKIRAEGFQKIQSLFSGRYQRRFMLSRKESTSSSTSASSNTNSTMVKEYFLPDVPQKMNDRTANKKHGALSITYYY